MKIDSFKIERFFSKYEFGARYLLSGSDCDGLSLEYILSLASEEEKQQWKNMKLGYSETRGSLMLRTAIARHYDRIGPDNVVVCSPGEANFALMNTYLQKGDEIICMAPSYQSLYEVAFSIGCKVSFWQAELRKGGWYFDTGSLKDLVNKDTRMIIINFPHNPTGFTPSIDEYNEIINIAASGGILLFSDEMYRFLMHDPQFNIPSACDVYENAVSLWGTSKSFGLAGLRLGWLTSLNQSILEKVESFKDYLSICTSPATEIPAAIALNNTQTIIRNNLEKIRINIGHFSKFAERNNRLLEFPVPNSGSTGYLPLNIKIPAADFVDRVFRDTGVLLLPSETFNHGSKHIRIGFGKENFTEGLDCLEKYINTKDIQAIITHQNNPYGS